MNAQRPLDRSSDPSPAGWIMGAAVALVGIGSVLAARRTRRREAELARAREGGTSVASEPVAPGPLGASGDDPALQGHPS